MKRLLRLLPLSLLFLMTACNPFNELFSPTPELTPEPSPTATETPNWNTLAIPERSLTQDRDVTPPELVMMIVTDPHGAEQRIPLQFTGHGLMQGDNHLMIPLSDQVEGGLASLGFITEIQVDGKSARLTYNDIIIDFDVESITCFVNDSPVAFLTDIPVYNNGTLYVPLEKILEVTGFHVIRQNNILLIDLEGEGHNGCWEYYYEGHDGCPFELGLADYTRY